MNFIINKKENAGIFDGFDIWRVDRGIDISFDGKI